MIIMRSASFYLSTYNNSDIKHALRDMMKAFEDSFSQPPYSPKVTMIFDLAKEAMYRNFKRKLARSGKRMSF